MKTNEYPGNVEYHADTESAAFSWSDDYLVGHETIDAVHREFVVAVDELFAARDQDCDASFDRLCSHLVAHFNSEKRLMEASGYPGISCHVDEHERVLESTQSILRLTSEPERFLAMRRFGKELGNWFPAHTAYLDAPLSHWLAKQRFGGKPILVRTRIRGHS